MKFDFSPKVEVTAQERELLINFSRAVEEACNNAMCDSCVLNAVCSKNGGNVVRFLDALFEVLGIY